MRLLKLAIVALLLLPGCVEHDVVYVRSAPPPGAVVVYQRPGYVWVPGYYARPHVYVRGHYRRRY
jgi:hypothetical protein